MKRDKQQDELRGTKKSAKMSSGDDDAHRNFAAVSEKCRGLFFEDYGVPPEVTNIVLQYVRMAPIQKRSREIEREKLVCWKAWRQNGTPKWECHWKDVGDGHGRWKHYWRNHGLHKSWYEDGRPEMENYWKEGNIQGVWKAWHENGNLAEEWHYRDGEEDCTVDHGVSKSWSKDGTLTLEWNSKDGKDHGVQRQWDQNGTPLYEHHYRDGEKHGVWKEWYQEDETVKSEHHWKDGKECGVWKEWHKDGALKCEHNWKDGIPLRLGHRAVAHVQCT